MCSRVQCKTCGKPTWQGCGLHIEQALEGVALDERCHCAPSVKTPTKASGLLARLFGR